MKNHHAYISEIFEAISKNQIYASAELHSTQFCNGVNGAILFYRHPKENGIFVACSLFGLPDGKGTKRYEIAIKNAHSSCERGYNRCATRTELLRLPELVGNSGFAFSIFYTEEVPRSVLLGKTVTLFQNNSSSSHSDEAIAYGLILPS